jgi:pilus assembly protein Flp/PilA
MRTLYKVIAGWRPLRSERGVTAIEYGLIAALIAVVIITAVALIGTNLTAVFNYIAGKIVVP